MKKSTKKQELNGAVLYEGPSAIDGAPIVLIITQMANKSANRKTGHMVQTYILRQDIKPIEAVKIGADVSICGDCKHRPALAKNNGEARCYVNIGNGPDSVWKAYKRGSYPKMNVSELVATGQLADKAVRFGSYGDPAACPIEIFQTISANCKKFTGYTHQWRAANFNPEWAALLMASVDNIFEQFEAVAKGYRYFRVQLGTAAPLAGEISCPASKEAGARTVCASCCLCSGTSKKAKNIVIQDHGIGWQKRQRIADLKNNRPAVVIFETLKSLMNEK